MCRTRILESPAAQMSLARLGASAGSILRVVRSPLVMSQVPVDSYKIMAGCQELPLEQCLELLPKEPEASDILRAEHLFDLVKLREEHMCVRPLRLLQARGDER